MTELHEDRERSGRSFSLVGDPRREQLHPASRIHGADDVDTGVTKLRGDPSHGDRVGHLVRDQHAWHAGGDHHPGLPDRRGRDAPCAGVELAPPELGRHRGLAVRRQLDAMGGAVLGHQGDVVRERRLPEHEHRRKEILEHPSPPGDIGQRYRFLDGGEALRGRIDPDISSRVEGRVIRRHALAKKRGRKGRFTSSRSSSRGAAPA